MVINNPDNFRDYVKFVKDTNFIGFGDPLKSSIDFLFHIFNFNNGFAVLSISIQQFLIIRKRLSLFLDYYGKKQISKSHTTKIVCLRLWGNKNANNPQHDENQESCRTSLLTFTFYTQILTIIYSTTYAVTKS